MTGEKKMFSSYEKNQDPQRAITFRDGNQGVTVFRRSDDSIAFKGVLEGQLYLVDFDRAELDTCLIAKTNMGWLWHRRLAHVGMKTFISF